MRAPLSLANDCKLNNMLKIKSISLNNVNLSLHSNKGCLISNKGCPISSNKGCPISNKECPNNVNPNLNTNKKNLKPSFNMIRKNRFH